MLGNRGDKRRGEETRAKGSSFAHQKGLIQGSEWSKNEILGRLVQMRGNERRREERRGNGRYFERS